MLRGTVYTMLNGVPVYRRVLHGEMNTREEFELAALALMANDPKTPPGSILEFGPIGEPWRKL